MRKLVLQTDNHNANWSRKSRKGGGGGESTEKQGFERNFCKRIGKLSQCGQGMYVAASSVLKVITIRCLFGRLNKKLGCGR